MQPIGQEQAIALLTQSVTQSRCYPAYLFVGADGIGKSLGARYFVELILGARSQHPDLLWIPSAPAIKIDQIREISKFVSRPPLQSSRSIVVVENAETMTESAANALLKTLEEPGQSTLILLALTTNSLLPTIASRCQVIPFKRLDAIAMSRILTQTGHSEILQNRTVLDMACGSPGSAIAAWEQLKTIPPEILAIADNPPTTTRQSLELARSISKELDSSQHLWLIDYLQHSYWRRYRDSEMMAALARSRIALTHHANPRLVWECLLLGMGSAP